MCSEYSSADECVPELRWQRLDALWIDLQPIHLQIFMTAHVQDTRKSCIFMVYVKILVLACICVCVCGGGLGCRSQDICPRHSQFQSRHSELQSATRQLSAARNCDHAKNSSASAKYQIARGFHVHITSGKIQEKQEFIEITGIPGFPCFPCFPVFS